MLQMIRTSCSLHCILGLLIFHTYTITLQQIRWCGTMAFYTIQKYITCMMIPLIQDPHYINAHHGCFYLFAHIGMQQIESLLAKILSKGIYKYMSLLIFLGRKKRRIKLYNCMKPSIISYLLFSAFILPLNAQTDIMTVCYQRNHTSNSGLSVCVIP